METNYLGPVVAYATFLPLLSTTSVSPSILLIASVASLVPAPTRSLYASTKSAALSLHQCVALESDILGLGVRFVQPSSFPLRSFRDASFCSPRSLSLSLPYSSPLPLFPFLLPSPIFLVSSPSSPAQSEPTCVPKQSMPLLPLLPPPPPPTKAWTPNGPKSHSNPPTSSIGASLLSMPEE